MGSIATAACWWKLGIRVKGWPDGPVSQHVRDHSGMNTIMPQRPLRTDGQ
jgi:hypothetical protein